MARREGGRQGGRERGRERAREREREREREHPHGRRRTPRTSTLVAKLLDLPDRRKRAILAVKIKRAVLEAGGRKDQLEVEFATASVWFQGKKVAGGGTAPHSSAMQVGCGWVDESALAGMPGGRFPSKVGTPQRGSPLTMLFKLYVLLF